MALLTAQGISRLAVVLLRRSLVLPMTAARVPAGEFGGPNGGTISVRVRQNRTANTQTTPGASITLTGIDEQSVDVSLAHHYDGVNLTDEEATLELEDFAVQVLQPQVDAVADKAELELATAMNDLTADASFDLSASAADTKAKLQTARETLSNNNVPTSDRWLACAPDIITRLLNVDEFVRADALGDGASTALREARPGRIYGFNVVESSGLDAGTAIAYHRSGFVFANATPRPPRGNERSAAVTDSGLSLRHILQYNPQSLTDQSVLSTFAGAAAVYEDGATATDNQRFYKLDTATV